MGTEKRDAKAKQKEKKQKQGGSRKYGQAKLKHSRMGIYSCIYAAISLALLLTCILIAFVMRGNTFGIVGGVGIISIVLAGFGIRASRKGMLEREKRYTTCKAGLAGNIVILLLLAAIFLGGLF
ncbi:MAG: hypothetical protein QM793_07045 [Muricomes sp.]